MHGIFVLTDAIPPTKHPAIHISSGDRYRRQLPRAIGSDPIHGRGYAPLLT
jgi:hypothetical protein